MNISVIGTGYVGLITGACLAELGSTVICMDTDEEKIDKLKRGEVTIYEPGLEEIIQKNSIDSKRLTFTTDIKEAAQKSEIIFITVGTPTQEDGSADLSYFFKAAKDIAMHMDGYKIIVDKSTVPVGTAKKVKMEIKNVLLERNMNIDFDVISNPEFLREGTAVQDFFKPDRIVLGAESERALTKVKSIYECQGFKDVPIITTNLETAEMIKYASNAFLAAKISFINEIANICEACGANIKTVSYAMGLDKRIGPQFLKAGAGFGGSCFPKDIKALISTGKKLGYTPQIIKSVWKVNCEQRGRMIKKIEKAVGCLNGKTVTILGLAFKPGTDDIRESPAITIIEYLLDSGAIVKVYDPKAVENFKKTYPLYNVEYCGSEYSASKNSDCIVLVTEWTQFSDLDFKKLKSLVKTPVFLDFRNVYDKEHVAAQGFSYEGVGVI